MIRKGRYIIIAAVTGLIISIFSSCSETDDWEKEEAAEIQEYLDSHPTLNYELKESGLYYLDTVVGTGDLAETHDTAYIFFSGYYLDGTKFASNVGTTDTIVRPVNEGWLITGFDEAVTYMREGGKSKIVLPSKLAYYNFVPLLYEIYLVKLVAGPGPDGK